MTRDEEMVARIEAGIAAIDRKPDGVLFNPMALECAKNGYFDFDLPQTIAGLPVFYGAERFGFAFAPLWKNYRVENGEQFLKFQKAFDDFEL